MSLSLGYNLSEVLWVELNLIFVVVQPMNDEGIGLPGRDLSSFPKSFLRLPSFPESRAISSGVTVHE